MPWSEFPITILRIRSDLPVTKKCQNRIHFFKYNTENYDQIVSKVSLNDGQLNHRKCIYFLKCEYCVHILNNKPPIATQAVWREGLKWKAKRKEKRGEKKNHWFPTQHKKLYLKFKKKKKKRSKNCQLCQIKRSPVTIANDFFLSSLYSLSIYMNF